MARGEIEGCCEGRRAVMPNAPNENRDDINRLKAFNDVLARLRQLNVEQVKLPAFEDQLWLHFKRLPSKYSIDVNVERSEDIITHQRLLHLAKDSANRPVFEVRLVQVSPTHVTQKTNSNCPQPQTKEEVRSCLDMLRIHPPPTFGSSTNLEALGIEANFDGDNEDNVVHSNSKFSRPMHEITFSSMNNPKLLCQLTSLLSEIELNIQEAHAFSTTDGFSLDVFVVDGWPLEESEKLTDEIKKKIKTKAELSSNQQPFSAVTKHKPKRSDPFSGHVEIPTDKDDVWEINVNLLHSENKVASGSFGDLYKGTYCSQEVSIKVIKPELLSPSMLAEFAHEVFIMRKIRHKNVVQFIGACTQPPNLCIVTEFMSKRSVYDYLHKQNGAFTLPALLRVAIDVSKGMNYLHQNHIVHRNLKTANILMNENNVKVSDFGVARVLVESGVMTAETGTYRWMAPEVILHKPYSHKADVFSFGIVLWELLTGELPYADLKPVKAANGVIKEGLRPKIPETAHPKLVGLIEKCWHQNADMRPDFSEIISILQQIAKEVGCEGEDRRKDRSISAFFSLLKRGKNRN
ncbi:serine/threonine-protein kinase STY8-like [Impatiens glandulifera]|uniref:serine/threonine-protein kinase STY8-like n=1 Tax=Impatiens glandulifera TaxID=253017 RepID=UPI001FB08FDA|nr:serine/threonine-protein kinase STY8-like [Impatiens glandulifera]